MLHGFLLFFSFVSCELGFVPDTLVAPGPTLAVRVQLLLRQAPHTQPGVGFHMHKLRLLLAS